MLSLLLNVIGLCIQKLGQPGHLLSSEFEISILLGAVVCQKGSMGERGNKRSNFNNKDLIKFFKHAMQSLALPEKEELKCSPVAEWSLTCASPSVCDNLAPGESTQDHSWGPGGTAQETGAWCAPLLSRCLRERPRCGLQSRCPTVLYLFTQSSTVVD